jgi:uncharacterized protein
MPPAGERPLIDYPCKWEYRVIGTDTAALRTAITEVLTDLHPDQNHTITPANRNGKYLSLSVSLTVRNEPHRDAIYQALNRHPTTRMVL